MSFHYFAGFTGGRKLVCPGLASSRTVSATHKLAFDCSTLSRREGVDTGRLDGNAVHEAFVEVVFQINPSFSVNTIIDGDGNAVEMYCGDWKDAHRAACDAYAAENTVEITEKRDAVIVSAGGYPHDINLIQAHKALDAASRCCLEGGTIFLIAECPDGTGRADFLDWFRYGNSTSMAEALCAKYQVNGQTAWNLRRITERFDVRVIAKLPSDELKKMGSDRNHPNQSDAGQNRLHRAAWS